MNHATEILRQGLQRVAEKTHPVQFAAIGILGVLDFVALVLLNRYKKDHADPSPLTWNQKRNTYRVIIWVFMIFASVLDAYFPIDSMIVVPIKATIFSFPLGLLDVYYSETQGVDSFRVFVGAFMWSLAPILKNIYCYRIWGEGAMFGVVYEVTLHSLALEMIRFTSVMALAGILTDLAFSPMHRLLHSPKYYKHFHKVHHEFTNNLNSLVLYYGAALDDFLMAFTTAIGGIIYTWILYQIGCEYYLATTFCHYLAIFNILLSHAHDIRCSKLIAPVPDSVNFVAYHWVHHIHPNANLGLTEPSDLVWDWVLGVNTIMDFQKVLVDEEKRRSKKL